MPKRPYKTDAVLEAAEVEIGKIVVKDDVDASTARVKTPATMLETDVGLKVFSFVFGLTSGAALAADAAATIQQYLRTLAVNLGYLDAAKVDTDAAGSIGAKLRGVVSRLASIDTVLARSSISDLTDDVISDKRLDGTWYQVSNADLVIGQEYEFSPYTTIATDTGIFRWATTATAVAPDAADMGRLCYMHSPTIVVPKAGHVRLWCKAITPVASWGDLGYWTTLNKSR